MTKARILFVAAILMFAVFASCLALHEYLYTFDPYGWAVPGEESDISRDLFMARAHLYRVVGATSFLLTLVFSGTAWVSKRRERKN